MSLHIIIDGYNLIRRSNNLSSFDHMDIQTGREALIDTLVSYNRLKHHDITVVFDGINAPLFSQNNDKIKGIHIRFSHNGESADSVIKRMAAEEREKALIVSSDMDIVKFSATQGAATISSSKFEEKMILASYMDVKGTDIESDYSGWVPTTKKKGPSKRRSKRERKNRLRIRKL